MNDKTIHDILFPSIIIGAVVPILIPLGLLLIGKIRKSKSIWEGKKIMNTAWAIGQAALLGSIISSLYKAFTGRIQPDLSNFVTDISNNFQFGFWNHGIFWGWPSSHTTIAFAMAVTLIILYPRNKIIKYLALLYALYIGVGVSIDIHWFSEFIAGAIIGSVIGVVVGKSFKEKLNN
jgi:membrane-associated phospholipid phosphatase